MEFKEEKVLVTGASGYIALHCINELLKSGYKVKGSLRNLERQYEVKQSIDSSLLNNQIEFCSLNLLSDEGWEEAADDCDYLIHVASPFIIEEPKDENTLISPALNGTLRALKAAKKANLKKVVLTSSMASIAYGHSKHICNPNDWTDTKKEVGAYIKSKTIAEKAAWEFVNSHCESFSMTTIHPGMVFGPLLSKDIDGASATLINNMIKGKFPALPQIYFTVVDVRDVAKIHVKSLENKLSDNKRVIVTSKNGISFLEIANCLRALGFTKCPQKLIPNQVISSLAPFNKEMRSTSLMIKRGCYDVDISETISIFNWDQIPLEKTLEDMTNSLKLIE